MALYRPRDTLNLRPRRPYSCAARRRCSFTRMMAINTKASNNAMPISVHALWLR